ncbi:MAG: 3-dehydroquinate synthase family protein [Phycisphaerales bacterium]|jgi:3-dehydroquinate synthase
MTDAGTIDIAFPTTTHATRVEASRGAASRIGPAMVEAGLSVEGRLVLAVGDSGAAEVFERVESSLRDRGADVAWHRVEATEANKVQATADRIIEWAIEQGADRGTPIVAVGGGIVCDLAGHVAGTLLRGLPLVLVPTTLLAMVDAAYGGKTAVNVPLSGGRLGRNLVGGFLPATLVAADVSTLRTLPERDLRAGLAECVKHGWVDGEAHLARLESDADAITDGGASQTAALEGLVRRSIEVKAAIVTRDPFEQGERRHLNLGHTFAHAIEARPGNRWRHGEAVAIGLVAAAAASSEAGLAEAGVVERTRSLLERLGLPVALDEAVPVEALRALMDLDKKRKGRSLRLVLPVRPGAIEVVEGPPEAVIAAGWSAVAARP